MTKSPNFPFYDKVRSHQHWRVASKSKIQEKFNVSYMSVESQCAKKSALVAILTIQQLRDMTKNTIKAQYSGPQKNSLGYSKLYSK